MQRKLLLKISFIIFISILFLLTISINATNESADDLIVGSRASDVADDPVVMDEDEEANENEEADLGELTNEEQEEPDEDSIGSTATDEETTTSTTQTSNNNAGTVTYSGSQTSQPTKSYSTIATLPEANLSMNNILNVILIAIGVIIILLAIAILIRLK